MEHYLGLFSSGRGTVKDVLRAQIREICGEVSVNVRETDSEAATATKFEINSDGEEIRGIVLLVDKYEVTVSPRGSAGLKITPPSQWRELEELCMAAIYQLQHEKAIQEQADMFKTVLHDLAGPLTLILGSAECIATSGIAINTETKEDLAVIEAAVHTIKRMANNVMHCLLAENDALAMHKNKHGIRSLFGQILSPYVGRCRLMIKTAQTHFEVDATHFERMVCNLLNNAITYGGSNPVTVTVDDKDGVIVVSVSDRGPGVGTDPERIFEKYYRGPGARNKEGYGLGLAYCRQICRLHGGVITAKNNDPGPGATFEVRIPKPNGTVT